ncbi:hypothetical protein LEMLEM_LOCUS2067 [Lemmus lemmus]
MLAGWTGCFSARRSTENSRRKVTVLYGPSPNSSFLPFCFLFLSTSTAIRIFCPGVASSTGGLPLHTHQSLSKKMPYRLACHPRPTLIQTGSCILRIQQPRLHPLWMVPFLGWWSWIL